MANKRAVRSQSSIELLITVSFALIILIPLVVLALQQISASSSNLAVTEAQAAAAKLADVATTVGSQGPPARQLVLIQVPPDVQSIFVGNQINAPGHSITFVVNTNAGLSDAVAYVPLNVSGNMDTATLQGTYLINVSYQADCPSATGIPWGIPCVYMSPS
jgi:hypothetical protein